MRSASRKLPSTVSVGNKLKRWNTNPIRFLRSSVRSASRHRREVLAFDNDAPGARSQEAAERVEKGRFAAARRPHDGDELAAAYSQIQPAQRVHITRTHRVGLPERLSYEGRRRRPPPVRLVRHGRNVAKHSCATHGTKPPPNPDALR